MALIFVAIMWLRSLLSELEPGKNYNKEKNCLSKNQMCEQAVAIPKILRNA